MNCKVFGRFYSVTNLIEFLVSTTFLGFLFCSTKFFLFFFYTYCDETTCKNDGLRERLRDLLSLGDKALVVRGYQMFPEPGLVWLSKNLSNSFLLIRNCLS